jgi:hypothetical protein
MHASRRLILAAGLSVLALPAIAQTPPATPPTRIRGAIKSIDGNLMVVTSRDGATLTITLADPVAVSTLKAATLADIKPGTYVGTASAPQPDGSLQAIEVLIFPESARGAGEGHYAWDLAPNTMMTNATVDASVAAANGNELTLTHKGGSVKVKVPPGAPIVTPAPATRADLKPGAKVFLAGTRTGENAFTAARVTVETNGIAPPM